MDKHHIAGRANSPITVSIPVNDHRAVLSVDQYHWPAITRENRDGSPLVAAAGCIRGFIDTIQYLIEELLMGIADMLESFDSYLTTRLGSRWWIGTPYERFAPKGKSNANR